MLKSLAKRATSRYKEVKDVSPGVVQHYFDWRISNCVSFSRGL